jgi:hypothetical protein
MAVISYHQCDKCGYQHDFIPRLFADNFNYRLCEPCRLKFFKMFKEWLHPKSHGIFGRLLERK